MLSRLLSAYVCSYKNRNPKLDTMLSVRNYNSEHSAIPKDLSRINGHPHIHRTQRSEYYGTQITVRQPASISLMFSCLPLQIPHLIKSISKQLTKTQCLKNISYLNRSPFIITTDRHFKQLEPTAKDTFISKPNI